MIYVNFFRPAYLSPKFYFRLSTIRCITHVSDNVTVPFADKYNSKIVERDKYDKWESAGYFKPTYSDKKFSMILPPPNITGTLHLGHALTITIQDILCRWKRMEGYSVLWIPGTDHAGIATQVTVEKHLNGKTGQSRHDIGREKFLELVEQWRNEKTNKIIQQVKQLGASVDWSKFFFTMDLKQSDAVTEAVIRTFDEGLLYRKTSPVNWSCHLLSTISDYEIEYMTINECTNLKVPGYDEPVQFGLLYDFIYKVVDSDEQVVVSTTRPETVFGDVAVAVHPDDNRYSHLHDRQLWHPFRRCSIPIILDKFVNPNLGTGAVKISPSHSKVDFDIGERYNLPFVSVFTESGYLSEVCGEFRGLKRFSRGKILDRFSELGLLKCVKSHKMMLPLCSRTGDVIEQMLKSQWFIKCNKLAERAVNAAENGDLDIQPEKYKKTYLKWLNDSQDWCISRQLWWGHRLPLYETEHGWVAARSENDAKIKAETKFKTKCDRFKQDEDVLDTWFSSALLPFSSLGWPRTDGDLKKFYPLNLLETGGDILNFWVVRMVLLGLHFTDRVPFKKVLLHGLLADGQGRKMSKSKGNVIEFDSVINGITLKELNDTVKANNKIGLISDSELAYALKFQHELFPQGIWACGADAVRFTLANLDSEEYVIKFSPSFCVENSKFCNKMWQASKFIIGWSLKLELSPDRQFDTQFLWQRWLLHRLSLTVDAVNNGLESTRLHVAAIALRNFFISDLCDTYVELLKPILLEGSAEEAKNTCILALYSLEVFLRLMSPFMPFIAEELYSYLPNEKEKPVWKSSYPKAEEFNLWKNDSLDKEMKLVKEIVSSTRDLIQRLRFNKYDVEAIVFSENNSYLEKYCSVIKSLTRCKSITYHRHSKLEVQGPVTTVRDEAVIQLILNEPLTSGKLKANLKILNSQIVQPQKELNERLKQSAAMKNPHDKLKDAVAEWNYLQSEIQEFIKYCLNKETPDPMDILKAAMFVPRIHDLKTRLNTRLKTK